MSLELTVRGKTYQVQVDSKGMFYTSLTGEDGSRNLQDSTLKGLESKLTAATRARTAKVALKLKRLGRKPPHGVYGKQRGYSYRNTDNDPWEVIEVFVRGINEHTGHPMVTWPDGSKSDDEEIGRYNRERHIYFPATASEADILMHRKLLDDTQVWFEKHSVDVVTMAKKAVAEALGE